VNNEQAFLALDIGSVKIAAVIGKKSEEDREYPQIFGQGICESLGLKKGIITNIQEASTSVGKAVADASRIAGMHVDKATVSISSSYTKGVVSHGIVNVIDSEISIGEIKRAIDTALYNAQVMLNEYRVIHVLPYMFKVDEHEGIDDPIGMNGSRLEAFVYVVTAQKSALSNLEKVIKNSGISIKNFVLDGYATSLSVVNKDEKSFGVATINMGGSISNLTITQGNTICYNNTISIGSNNITKDISITAQTNIQSAEKTKLEYASLLFDEADNETIELPTLGDSNKMHTISINIINQIVYARVEETLILLRKMLEDSGFKDNIGAGIILTGGMTKIKGMQEVASKIFDSFSVRISKPNKNFIDTLNDESYSTITGLIMYASGRYTKYEIDSNKILRYANSQINRSNTDVNLNSIIVSKDEKNTFLNSDGLNHKHSGFSNWLKDLF
jgi:cell division protein FtsA